MTMRVNRVEAMARAYYDEHGRWPAGKALAKWAGVNQRSAENALRTVKAAFDAAREANPIPRYTKAQETQIVARVKALVMAMEETFDARVRAAAKRLYDQNFPTLVEDQRKAHEAESFFRKMINDHKPPLTEAEFMTILACLHPDNSASPEKRDDAFKIFNAVKLQLAGKK